MRTEKELIFKYCFNCNNMQSLKRCYCYMLWRKHCTRFYACSSRMRGTHDYLHNGTAILKQRFLMMTVFLAVVVPLFQRDAARPWSKSAKRDHTFLKETHRVYLCTLDGKLVLQIKTTCLESSSHGMWSDHVEGQTNVAILANQHQVDGGAMWEEESLL